MTDQPIPIVCNLDALPDYEAHMNVGNGLLAQADAFVEIETGFQIQLPIDSLLQAADFVDGERRCCAFLNFNLHIAPAATHVVLQITGPDGTRMYCVMS